MPVSISISRRRVRFETTVKCARKLLDTADIVREAILQHRLALGCGAASSWRHEIFAGYDLPFPTSLDPGVRPDELSGSPILLLPSPAALRHGRVSVEANLDFVEMVEDEFGWVSAEIPDAIRFGIMAAVDVHSDEVISEDAI